MCADTNVDVKKKKVTKLPRWMGDEETDCCLGCHVKFTFFNRRHHCRGCGKIFCSKCTAQTLLLPKEPFGTKYQDIQVVCKPCFKKFSTIDHDSSALPYDLAGYESSPPLIILHGALYTRRSVILQIEYFKSYFRVFALDLPGHGSRMDEPFTIASSVRMVKDFIEKKIKEKSAVIYGYDFGGLVAIALAAQHPELCAGVIAAGSCANFRVRFRALNGLIKTISYKTRDKLIESVSSLNGTNIPQIVLEHAFYRSGQHFENVPQYIQAASEFDFEKLIQTYPGDILFVNGSSDSRVNEKAFVAAAKKGELQVIKTASQEMFVDPGYCVLLHDAVLKFLQRIGYLIAVVDHSVEKLSLDDIESSSQDQEEESAHGSDYEGHDEDHHEEDNVLAARLFAQS